MNTTLLQIKRKTLPILKKYHVKKAGIFGSYARAEEKKKSDVDILVEIKMKNVSLLDIIKLQQELEQVLKKKVDLLEYNEINHLLKKRILNEQVRIL